MNIIPDGVYGIVGVEEDGDGNNVGILAFLTRRYGWFSHLYHLNAGLDRVCVEPIRSRWQQTRPPRYVRFLGSDRIYWYRGGDGIWHGRSRSTLIPVTHPTMRDR